MFRHLGIGTRLLFAFFGITFFAVLSGVVALISFLEVGKVLHQIARFETPEAIESLEISRQAERMASAAPAMLSVTSIAQLEQIRASLEANSKRIDEKILRLKENDGESKDLTTMEWTVQQLHTNILELHDLIARRFQSSDARKRLLNEFREVNSKILRRLSASTTELDSQIRRARATGIDTSRGETQVLTILGLLESRVSLQAVSERLSSINEVFLEAQLPDRSDQISGLSNRGQKALGALEALTMDLDPTLAKPMKEEVESLHKLIQGASSIFVLLEEEASATAKARDILITNAWLSDELSGNVDEVVTGAKQNITDAIGKAAAAQKISTWVIVVIILMSLFFSTLIVWLYVGRSIIARLAELSVSMESVAGGDLKVQLPDSKVDDEIGRMTKALTIFRDTAVEIEENNLREIGQSRQRLLDAIESISEGFCYFDSNDRLVVANSNYRSLMYPGAEATVLEGMTFEEVIRNAAERGYVKDAENRVDEWVAERLAQHRQPDAPHIQQRSDGRWIMVSERRTGDRGTVAVYSDITELKQREEELAEKSSSMEQLSNQISKYLSPQIYESIFTGKREVKVASHRRKLSVFFSDIVGFTETAEQLESEDLTKLLNHYLTEMSDIAMEYGATIDKYVGDAIVIFFGDPETRGIKEDALACVKMAIAMRQRLTELQGIWRDSGISKPLQCRIGINTGFCTVGNFGSETRMDYTIIGSGVNLAARLESAATPGEILVSHETYALVKDQILCDSVGTIELKGISHPVENYRVVNLYTNLQRDREVIREGFPYFNLEIDLEKLSANDHSRAVVTLRRALEKLSRAEEDEIRSALSGPRVAHS